MRRVLALAAITAGLLLTMAPPASATWAGTHCRVSEQAISTWKRSQARAYADVARYEGYEWGGGCWNDNNVDDTPNAPDSGGEGPDCSGLVFKAWALPNSYGAWGRRWYDKLEDVHGPYVAASFAAPGSSLPFFGIGKGRATTLYMDAFASSGHVGMLYTDTPPSSGGDYIIEALGDAYGTNVFVETYRSSSAFTAARRRGWTAECYPRCAVAGALTATSDARGGLAALPVVRVK